MKTKLKSAVLNKDGSVTFAFNDAAIIHLSAGQIGIIAEWHTYMCMAETEIGAIKLQIKRSKDAEKNQYEFQKLKNEIVTEYLTTVGSEV
jgi:hypothetical protein